jgi:hypothetical protein
MVVPIHLDESLWPLLLVRFTGVASESDFEEYLSRLYALLERREPFVIITDTTQLSWHGASLRHRQAEWSRKHEAAMRERVLGHATIITSTFVRLSVSILDHLYPRPMPHVEVANLPSALAWVTERLQRAGHATEAERIRRHFGLVPGLREG